MDNIGLLRAHQHLVAAAAASSSNAVNSSRPDINNKPRRTGILFLVLTFFLNDLKFERDCDRRSVAGYPLQGVWRSQFREALRNFQLRW